MPMPPVEVKREVLTWEDVDKLMDHLIPQLQGPYDAMLIITRGGLIPGGLICDAMDIRHILTASVQFYSGVKRTLAWSASLWVAWRPDRRACTTYGLLWSR